MKMSSSVKSKLNSLASFQQTLLKRQMQLKDLEKEKLEIQSKNKMYILWTVIIVFLLFGSTLYYSYHQKKKANTLLFLQKEEIRSALIKLQTTQTQLIQKEKMASLGELTAGIAHEIQNPLNFVNNYSEVNMELMEELEEEVKKDNKEEVKALLTDLRENESKIHHHGKRADAIVQGMLQHSRTSSGTKELTNLNALADEYLRLAYQSFLAKEPGLEIELSTDYEKNLPLIEVVPQDIGRVLLNILNNAFQACAEKSRMQLKGYKPNVKITTKKLGGSIEISIADNGNGIPDGILDKIFQPFFTTRPTGQGTGLGLSLAYDIVKAHGGELKVESENGKMTEFLIELPVSAVPQANEKS